MEHNDKKQKSLFGVRRDEISRKIPSEKLLADLLKRQARQVMADITECPPDTIPAHLTRLNCLRELINHAIEHECSETPEARRSDRQLMYASTLADYLACLEITRRSHRAPAFINQRDDEISQINRKIDMLAGFLFRDREAVDFFSNRQPQDEL